MSLQAFQEHWLFGELFREPEGGWLGWGVLALGIIFIAYESYIGNFWMIPLIVFPLAEVFPEGDAETAGLLRLVGVLYLFIYAITVIVTSFIA